MQKLQQKDLTCLLIAGAVYEEIFFQNALSANPEKEIMFWKRALHKYLHIYAFLQM